MRRHHEAHAKIARAVSKITKVLPGGIRVQSQTSARKAERASSGIKRYQTEHLCLKSLYCLMSSCAPRAR